MINSPWSQIHHPASLLLLMLEGISQDTNKLSVHVHIKLHKMVEWNKLVTQIDGPHLPKAFTLWSKLSQFAWIVPLFSLNIACS